MLIRVDEVVVGGVVQEQKAEADGPAGEAGTHPGEARVRGPGEDEEADGDEPAAEHHRNEADLGGWVAIILVHHGHVVAVDQGRAGGRHNHTESDGDKH